MTLAHLKARDFSDDWYDRDTWSEFAKANLLGVAFPNPPADSASASSSSASCCGDRTPRRAAARHPDARRGRTPDRALRHRRAAGGARQGRRPETCSSPPRSSSSAPDPSHPSRPRRATGDGWRLDGVKSNVPGAHVAELVLVPATTGDDVAIFLVPTNANGVSTVRQQTMNHEPLLRADARRCRRRRRCSPRRARSGSRDPDVDAEPRDDRVVCASSAVSPSRR